MTMININQEQAVPRFKALLTEAKFAHILTAFPLVAEPVKVAALNAYRDVERGLVK